MGLPIPPLRDPDTAHDVRVSNSCAQLRFIQAAPRSLSYHLNCFFFAHRLRSCLDAILESASRAAEQQIHGLFVPQKVKNNLQILQMVLQVDLGASLCIRRQRRPVRPEYKLTDEGSSSLQPDPWRKLIRRIHHFVTIDLRDRYK
jgi:hypothetical protein